MLLIGLLLFIFNLGGYASIVIAGDTPILIQNVSFVVLLCVSILLMRCGSKLKRM